MARRLLGNVFIRNSDFERAPAFTAATNTNNKWIDGTAAGGSGNIYEWFLQKAGTVAAQFDTAQFDTGSKSLKISTLASGANALVLSAANLNDNNVRLLAVPVKPSTDYVVTFRMKTNYVSGDSNDGAYLQVLDYNGAGINTASHLSTKVKTTTGWTTYTVSFTTGSTVRFMIFQLSVTGNTGAASLIMDAWFDNLTLALATPPTRTAA